MVEKSNAITLMYIFPWKNSLFIIFFHLTHKTDTVQRNQLNITYNNIIIKFYYCKSQQNLHYFEKKMNMSNNVT